MHSAPSLFILIFAGYELATHFEQYVHSFFFVFEKQLIIFKSFGSEAKRIVQRLVIETYMGDCYREIEPS